MEKVEKLKLKDDWKQRGYSFGVFRDPPGQVWADFVHKTDELVVLAEGEIEIELRAGLNFLKSGKNNLFQLTPYTQLEIQEALTMSGIMATKQFRILTRKQNCVASNIS